MPQIDKLSFIMFCKIVDFIKKEIVFVISLLLAIISCFFVKPSIEYISYIDFNVLFLLFSFMTVANCLKHYGFFDLCADFLCTKVKNTQSLSIVLIFMCFFFSMFITNDVALLTFVPFTILILQKCEKTNLLIYVIVLETIAANLGSMTMPMGNPQNLFLFGAMNISFFDFCKIILPYSVISAVTLLICAFFIKKEPLKIESPQNKNQLQKNQKVKQGLYIILFIFCIFSVLKILPSSIMALIIFVLTLFINFFVLKQIDYVLLLTFCAFFVFTGNISNIETIKEFLEIVTAQKEFITSLLVSQIISNVPAALLLYPFCQNTKELLLGVNIGGLGTLIASLASLISFKLYTNSKNKIEVSPQKFFICFTILNILFLVILIFSKFLIQFLQGS